MTILSATIISLLDLIWAFVETHGIGITALATTLLALATWLLASQAARDRKLRYIDKRLDEFYRPLLQYFYGYDPITPQTYTDIRNILVNRRYLCNLEVLEFLPFEFPSEPIRGYPFRQSKFTFKRKEDLDKWLLIADIIRTDFNSILYFHPLYYLDYKFSPYYDKDVDTTSLERKIKYKNYFKKYLRFLHIKPNKTELLLSKIVRENRRYALKPRFSLHKDYLNENVISNSNKLA